MQVSERGAGVYGCGLPTQNGIVKYEAMRWILSVLNQRSGSTFLPGISLGKLVTSKLFEYLCLVPQIFIVSLIF